MDALLARLGVTLPIVQAPMATAAFGDLAAAVSSAGGLGSLGCVGLDPDEVRREVATIRAATDRAFALNFFCHPEHVPDRARDEAWRTRLLGYYVELGLDPERIPPATARPPFGVVACGLVEELAPRVVSFHFGLPDPSLVARVKRTGAVVVSTATSVAEARWLVARGVDAIVAQGAEAGGPRGSFLPDNSLATRMGTMALVPQIVDAVKVPVLAAGGIADGRGIAAALALGAAAAQIGTAYLLTPEARISPPHARALREGADTVMTNVFTGSPSRVVLNRFVRELGPMSNVAPAFPSASSAVAPLRARAEAADSGDFSPLWSGQAARLAKEMPAADLTRKLAADARARIASLTS